MQCIRVVNSASNKAAKKWRISVVRDFLIIVPYIPKRAKQLSMASIPLCFVFFRGRVDVLQS